MQTAVMAPTRPREWARIAAMTLLVVALFHFLGMRPSALPGGQSALAWIFDQWIHSGGDFSHGWTMPLISLYAIWANRKGIASAPKRIHPGGLLIVVSALLLLLGIQAASKLEVRQFPELEESVITVRTVYPGASASTVEGFVTSPLQRAIASARLGDKFDIRDFHDVILGSGALPLSTLEQLVNDWIETVQ